MNMYPQPDAPDQTSADTPSPNGAGGEGEDQEEKMQGETALLPKSILGGKEFNPGDEVVLKIVGLHDDQVEVEYAAEEKPEAGNSMAKGDGAEMGASQNKLTSMAGMS